MIGSVDYELDTKSNCETVSKVFPSVHFEQEPNHTIDEIELDRNRRFKSRLRSTTAHYCCSSLLQVAPSQSSSTSRQQAQIATAAPLSRLQQRHSPVKALLPLPPLQRADRSPPPTPQQPYCCSSAPPATSLHLLFIPAIARVHLVLLQNRIKARTSLSITV
ncbi:hypothetical protein JCGZ_13111 [Jatropha curcas]|uniref:Uncharacterized protein n=1 Tax=Jatropha curcas TaxID=180498 RepID=A0A067K8J6_JATCU|nr:hypothetical protein JCGZ_13111 [Jatropha curcas]